jgi:hypothetical protein
MLCLFRLALLHLYDSMEECEHILQVIAAETGITERVTFDAAIAVACVRETKLSKSAVCLSRCPCLVSIELTSSHFHHIVELR